MSSDPGSPIPDPVGAFHGQDQPSMALIDACVHCGFCLPSCPTYVLWNEEMDSPRGRVYLMKLGTEGAARMTPTYVEHFDRFIIERRQVVRHFEPVRQAVEESVVGGVGSGADAPLSGVGPVRAG